MRGMYGYRRRRFATRHASATDKRVADFAAHFDGADEDYETRSAAFQCFRRELLEAEREAVLRLEQRGQDRGRGHAQDRTRPRPRGLTPGDLRDAAVLPYGEGPR